MKKQATKNQKGNKTPLLVAGATLLAFGIYKYANSNSVSAFSIDSSDLTDNNSGSAKVTPGSNSANKTKVSAPKWVKETWPLSRGMQGQNISYLQTNLNKLGSRLVVDGKFGAGTETALTKLGYSVQVDKGTFEQITKKANPAPVLTPYQSLVKAGYKTTTEIDQAINLRNVLTGPNANLPTGIAQIRQILGVKNSGTLQNIVQAYKYMFKSPVTTDLLALKNARFKINDVITRVQPLSGIIEVGQKLKAANNTLVNAGPNRPFLNVGKGTILGYFQRENKGLTWFKDSKGQLLQVPSSDIITI